MKENPIISDKEITIFRIRGNRKNAVLAETERKRLAKRKPKGDGAELSPKINMSRGSI